MNTQSASSSSSDLSISSTSSLSTHVEDTPAVLIPATACIVDTPRTFVPATYSFDIYKESISSANEEAIIESAVLSAQHALEIERILCERNAYSTAAVLNTIRTAQLIEQEAMLIPEPAIKQSILHYQGRIHRLCYLLLPSNIKEDILKAVFTILKQTRNEIARPPSPHHLDEYVRIPSTPPPEDAKPVPPPRTATKDQTTISPRSLESGTKDSPIIISDSDATPPPHNMRIARHEQKRRL
ncbi:hypothetical protein EDD22DRAFT_954401 [Suillus occidentalis]|nr:hypothetical protein EDD22DRAFT_954401 [Suillus occidentalis]